MNLNFNTFSTVYVVGPILWPS